MGFGLYGSTVFFRFCLSYSLTPGVVKKSCVSMVPRDRKHECVWSEHVVRYVI